MNESLWFATIECPFSRCHTSKRNEMRSISSTAFPSCIRGKQTLINLIIDSWECWHFVTLRTSNVTTTVRTKYSTQKSKSEVNKVRESVFIWCPEGSQEGNVDWTVGLQQTTVTNDCSNFQIERTSRWFSCWRVSFQHHYRTNPIISRQCRRNCSHTVMTHLTSIDSPKGPPPTVLNLNSKKEIQILTNEARSSIPKR